MLWKGERFQPGENKKALQPFTSTTSSPPAVTRYFLFSLRITDHKAAETGRRTKRSVVSLVRCTPPLCISFRIGLTNYDVLLFLSQTGIVCPGMVEDEGPLQDASRFCCKYFKIINGAYMVAITYCVFIVCNLGLHIYKLYKSAEVKWNWQMLFTACDTVSVACLFYGLVRRRPAFLQPFTVVSITTVNFCILLTMSHAMAALYPSSYYGEQLEIALANNIQYIADALGVKNRQVLVCSAVMATVVYAGTVFIHSWFMVIVVHCAQWLRSTAEKSTLAESLMLEEKETSSEQAVPPQAEEDVERGIAYL